METKQENIAVENVTGILLKPDKHISFSNFAIQKEIFITLYKDGKISKEDLRNSIKSLAKKNGFKFKNIFSFLDLL